MNNVFLMIGSNLGNRQKNLDEALQKIGEKVGIIKRLSSVYETEPWGVAGQQHYLNQVAELLTRHDASSLLSILLSIEAALGRVRSQPYAARTMDIDILFFNNDTCHTDALTLPHPRLHLRKFVLIPMAEIAPEMQHPALQKTIAQLLQACTDEGAVKKI